MPPVESSTSRRLQEAPPRLQCPPVSQWTSVDPQCPQYSPVPPNTPEHSVPQQSPVVSVPRAYLVNEATLVYEDTAGQGVDVQCEVEVGHEELREE